MNKALVYFLCLGLMCSCEMMSFLEYDSSDAGTGGSMARFTVKGDYLYIADQYNLMTFDISDSSDIELKSIIQAGWDIETIFPTDSLLFLGSMTGMKIYSLKLPSKPVYVSEYTHITSCDPVVVKGRYAYVTLRSETGSMSCWRPVNELQVIDIRNILNPVKVASYEMNCPRGLAMTDSLLFVCDGLDLVVMNAVDPLNMRVKKRFEMDGSPFDVIARNGILTVSYSEGLSQYSYNGDTVQWISTVY